MAALSGLLSLPSAAAAAVILLAAQGALAQTLCPAASLGDACDGGLCVPATCDFATSDGGTVESACDLCYWTGPGACLPGQGTPCPTGETCEGNVGFGAGSAHSPDAGFPEAGTLTGFTGSYGTCMAPYDAGQVDGGWVDGGELGADDAAVGGNHGSDGGSGSGSGTTSRGGRDGGSGASTGTTASTSVSASEGSSSQASTGSSTVASTGSTSGHTPDAGTVKDSGATHTSGKDAGASSAGASSSDDSSGSCSVAEGRASGLVWPLGFAALGLMLARRRRSRSRGWASTSI